MKKLFFLMALAIAVKVSYASQGETRFDNPSQIQTTESLSIDSPAISFIASWSLGDSYTFRVTKSERQWTEGVIILDDTSSYVAQFDIIDSTATSYKIRWSIENDISWLPVDEKYYDMFSKFKTTEVIYTTTEFGEFVGIENWQELSDNMKGIVALILDIVSEEDPSMAASLQAAFNPLLGTFNSQEEIEEKIFNELLFFHFPFGHEYDVTETYEYQGFRPNIFGGKPLRSDMQLYFEEVDYNNATCKIIEEMQINSEDAKNATDSLIASMDLSDEEFDEAIRSAKYDKTYYNQYEYMYDIGVPIKIEGRKVVLLNLDNEEGKRVDEIIIEYVDLPVFTEDEIFHAPPGTKACLINTEKDCDKLSGVLRDDCCLSSIMSYLGQIEYPSQPRDLGLEGEVILRFVVEKDGKVTQIEKIRGHHMFTDSAIKHIQNSSGRWIPATNNGEPVRSVMVIPFVFKLNNNNDKEE